MSTHKNNKKPGQKSTSHSHQEEEKKKILLLKPIPLYIILLIFVPICAIGIFFYPPTKLYHYTHPDVTKQIVAPNDEVEIVRQADTGLVKPLLFAEGQNEKLLLPIKTKLKSYLEQKVRENACAKASIYLSDLNTGSQIDINPDELYDPASIMKVPCMIIYLKEAEANPELLNKKFFFKPDANNIYAATIKDKSIVAGHSYTVQELIYNMIVYSDNESFWLLCDNIDNAKFETLNKEFGIRKNMDDVIRPGGAKNFVASVGSVARYFSVLYNASYLNKKMSLYALNLLTKCTYNNGLLKGIDPKVKVAHKFGERTEAKDSQFHEFGIVYLKGRPYLLGIMTRGNQLPQLQSLLSELSRMVFDEMKADLN